MSEPNTNQPEDQEDRVDDNAPWHPEESTERTVAETDELNKISSSIAILDDFFADLDADIEETRGVDIIDGVNPSTDPKDLLIAVLVNQKDRKRLIARRKKYEKKYRPHLKKEGDEE